MKKIKIKQVEKKAHSDILYNRNEINVKENKDKICGQNKTV